MMRLLLISATLLLLYLSLSVLYQFDSNIAITIYDYVIDITVFTLLLCIAIIFVVSLIILRLIISFFMIPITIKRYFQHKQAIKTTQILIHTLSAIAANDKSYAKTISKKLNHKTCHAYQELYNFIQAQVAQDFDEQVQYLKQLVSSKDFGYFALKRLAQVLYQNKLYAQSEKYALLAFNMMEIDTEILVILMNCYGNLRNWSKFAFMVSKLHKVNKNALIEVANKVSEYYFEAAKDSLTSKEDNAALRFLELSLQYNQTYIPALDLYCILNVNAQTPTRSAQLLKTVFATNPSFAIAQMYMKATDITADDIYNELSNQIDQEQHQDLLLAIAAYLDLPKQIAALRRSITITSEER